ncbi:hypothetical protein B9Z55_011647 [Caenorhabditis nigoni]|uniref:Sdz-33 F-box domain-containing protein n=1 Tax=Caenorhabditis nigoni TaxID=1611254 RepID=A0A2G5UKZ0_9PELO|nr:hypothetical protein B9Z55_011647 [Caenorhabditis nigoni]
MLWSLLCRSSTTIVHIIHIVFCRIFWLWGVIYNFLFLRKSPAEDKKPRFPFLKLHYVAIREVLNTLDPLDQWTANREEEGTRKSRAYESYNILYKYSENSLDALKEFREYYLYIKSLMSVKIDTVVWDMSEFNRLGRTNVDCLRLNAPEFPALYVHGFRQRQEELHYILDNLKYTKSLEIWVDVIEPLQLRIADTLEELRIQNGMSITLDYIMSLEMRRLTFRNTYLTDEDLNVFFKSWIEIKSHLNLERFEINLWKSREDFMAIGLRDIPYRMGPMRPGPYPTYVPSQGSFEVTRNDGRTASICAYRLFSQFNVIVFARLSDLN